MTQLTDTASALALTLGLGGLCFGGGMLTVLVGVESVVPREADVAVTTGHVEAIQQLIGQLSGLMNAVIVVGGILLIAGGVAARWETLRDRIADAGGEEGG